MLRYVTLYSGQKNGSEKKTGLTWLYVPEGLYLANCELKVIIYLLYSEAVLLFSFIYFLHVLKAAFAANPRMLLVKKTCSSQEKNSGHCDYVDIFYCCLLLNTIKTF